MNRTIQVIGIIAIFITPKFFEPNILATIIVPAAEIAVENIRPTINTILPLADVWIISENFFSKPFLPNCILCRDKEYGLATYTRGHFVH